MSCINDIFDRLGHKALIAYLTVGYPDVDTTLKAAMLLADSGCDLIELGIPFSDPLADGATIQQASFQALRNGVTPRVCLDVAGEFVRKTDIPLVFMSYLNPVMRYGGSFVREARRAGVAGLIIPDLPPDEGGELEAIAIEEGLDLIYLLAPYSSPARVRLVAARSRGFIYLVSLQGVTGARIALSGDLEDFIDRVRAVTTTPLCVGFGISTPGQARQATALADGVIIGSRILQLIAEDASLRSLERFIKDVRREIDRL